MLYLQNNYNKINGRQATLNKHFYNYLLGVIMKNSIPKLCALISILIALNGCSFTSQIEVASTIPADMQQLIKSTKVESIQYNFVENSEADLIKFRHTIGAAIIYRELRLNDVLRPLLNELFQTKFSKISNESNDKVNIIVQNVIANTDEPNALALKIKIELDREGKISEKTLDYTVTIGTDARVQSDVIHSFLMKYIIGIDKFIDNEFDVQ